ncbi:hypothetical protein F2981_26100 (plasmid) [Sinorhizobium meliloti]|nr:hypothetical protein [Sinorhizobium meliloti]
MGLAGRPQPVAKGRDPASAFSSFVMVLRNDRWFQISYRQTSSGNITVLQTEITDIVRENRREKNRLIDQQSHLLQGGLRSHVARRLHVFRQAANCWYATSASVSFSACRLRF